MTYTSWRRVSADSAPTTPAGTGSEPGSGPDSDGVRAVVELAASHRPASKQPAVASTPGDVLVLSAGGLRGAVQAGMLAAVAESSWRPSAIVGVSAGALNGVFTAARFDVESARRLCDIWTELPERGVFPARTASKVLKLVTRAQAVQDGATMREMLDKCCPVDNLEDLETELHVGAMDLMSGEPVWFSAGPAVPALLASASVPGLVPPVAHQGRLLVDGAPVAAVPLGRAAELSARRIVCFDVSGEPVSAVPSTAFGVLLRSYAACREVMADIEERRVRELVDDVWRVQPTLPADLRSNDWSRTAELVEIGYQHGVDFIAAHRAELETPPADALVLANSDRVHSTRSRWRARWQRQARQTANAE